MRWINLSFRKHILWGSFVDAMSSKGLGFTLMIVSLLSLNNPAEAKTVDTYNFNQQGVEVLADSSIVSNIERRTWTVLPRLYVDKIKNFVANNELMKKHSAAEFTENFIVNQMKSGWWISKQNQLLFIWDAVYEQITKKNFYDWEDWDNNRLSEFENTMDSIENCWNKYKKEFIAYMEWRSAEANKEIIRATNSRLNNLITFYNLYKKDPSSIKQSEINQMQNSAKEIVQDCKQYNIDYKAKLSPEMLKFYGIE